MLFPLFGLTLVVYSFVWPDLFVYCIAEPGLPVDATVRQRQCISQARFWPFIPLLVTAYPFLPSVQYFHTLIIQQKKNTVPFSTVNKKHQEHYVVVHFETDVMLITRANESQEH